MKQITEHIEGNNLLPNYQSAYRRFHGVETAMIKMYHDLLNSVDKSKVTLVVMIDLSAAFDTIDIQIALDILQTDFGIQGTPLNWIKSYLSQRTMKVTIGSSSSDSIDLKYGVPQGSCAGPVIFTMYVAALRKVVRQYPTDLYGYADDHKLAFRFQAGNLHEEAIVLQHLNECLADIINWMTSFKLKMNNSKTEITSIVYGTKQQLAKVNLTSVDVGGCTVHCVNKVRDLGVLMNNALNFDRHIQKKCQISHVQLRNLKDIRNNLSQKSIQILVHGLVHSHLDFCNALFADLPAYQLDRLQRVQNHAARVVMNATYEERSIDLLKALHWLPIRARIMFKILVLVFRVHQGYAPLYIQSLFKRNTKCYRLRSTSDIQFEIPKTRIKIADRSIAIVGPKWWNGLPLNLKTAKNENVFRKNLKTYLFQRFFEHSN